MYYDIVCSVYEVNPTGPDRRIDSHLMSGGYATAADAQKEIPNYGATLKSDNPLLDTCFEVEEHNDDGSLNAIIPKKRLVKES